MSTCGLGMCLRFSDFRSGVHLSPLLSVFELVQSYNSLQIATELCHLLTFLFRSARTSCITFGWSVRSSRPVPSRAKNLHHLYTGIYAL